MTFTETTCTTAEIIQILRFVSFNLLFFDVTTRVFFTHQCKMKRILWRTSLKKPSRRTNVLTPGENCLHWPRRKVCQRSLWTR